MENPTHFTDGCVLSTQCYRSCLTMVAFAYQVLVLCAHHGHVHVWKNERTQQYRVEPDNRNVTLCHATTTPWHASVSNGASRLRVLHRSSRCGKGVSIHTSQLLVVVVVGHAPQPFVPVAGTHVETLRIYEALEAGCVPIVSASSPHAKGSLETHNEFLPLDTNHPLPQIVDDWTAGVESIVPELASQGRPGLDRLQQRVRRWWIRAREDIAMKVSLVVTNAGPTRCLLDRREVASHRWCVKRLKHGLLV